MSRSGVLFRAIPSRGCTLARALMFAALLLVGPPVRAEACVNQAKVDRLLEASGMKQALRNVLPTLLDAIDTPVDEEIALGTRRALRAAARQALGAGPMIERLNGLLCGTLARPQLDETLAWLASPLGRRIATLETEAASRGAAGRIREFARRLIRHPTSAERTKIIEALDRATGASELAITVAEAAVLTSTFGVNSARPVPEQVPAELLRARIRAGMQPLRQQTATSVKASLLYAYRALSDDDLKAYLEFLRSSAGMAYSKRTLQGLRRVLLEAFGRYMLAIPAAISKNEGLVPVRAGPFRPGAISARVAPR